MKFTSQINVFWVVALLLFNTNMFAQTSANEFVVTGDLGFSIYGAGVSVALKLSERLDIDTTKKQTVGNINKSSTRARMVAVDYGITDQWSIGLLYSNQKIDGSFDYGYKNVSGAFIEEQVSFQVNRSYLGVAPKIHYGSSKKMDFYSGARLGFLFFKTQIETTDKRFDLFNKITLSRPAIGVTPIGARFYINKFVGANIELNIGAPNIIGFGVQARFN